MDVTRTDNPFAAPAATASTRADDPEAPIYAGFWWRVLASLIDGAVMSPLIILSYMNTFWWHSALLALPVIVVFPLYKVLMEMRGGTLGKMACGIRIITADGRPPERRSLMRNVISLVSLVVQLPLLAFAPHTMTSQNQTFDVASVAWACFSYLIALLWLVCVLFVPFHSQKRGLHDLWSGTWCVRPSRRPG